MAWTQDQVDSLRAAIAKGVTSVRNANGESVEFRSLDEMQRLLATMEGSVSGAARVTHVNPIFERGV